MAFHHPHEVTHLFVALAKMESHFRSVYSLFLARQEEMRSLTSSTLSDT